MSIKDLAALNVAYGQHTTVDRIFGGEFLMCGP
jgi:hypothetical protein